SVSTRYLAAKLAQNQEIAPVNAQKGLFKQTGYNYPEMSKNIHNQAIFG
ncbi:MAG: hypothetical protein RIR90_506, partial [Bacteroidota bacterium]